MSLDFQTSGLLVAHSLSGRQLLMASQSDSRCADGFRNGPGVSGHLFLRPAISVTKLAKAYSSENRECEQFSGGITEQQGRSVYRIRGRGEAFGGKLDVRKGCAFHEQFGDDGMKHLMSRSPP